ncbi:MAG TPA: peptide-methionine (R)-S-oxide reductase, partial [Arthrobacter sp.]|nr:peptide-methionine (R)-S-oxide reductase [Arthrobacter sp.]
MSIFSNKPKVSPVAAPAGSDTDSATAHGTAPAGSSPAEKTDEQWRKELTPEEYRVLRQAGTERPYTGEYWDTHTAGVYQCRACGSELFTSQEKFDSHCGWPSFWAPLADGTVRYIHDRTLGMERVEV